MGSERVRYIKNFIKLESASAYVLFASTLLALLLCNSSWNSYYFLLNKKLLHITNDGLMTIFFLVVGLEIKYELLYGALNSFGKALLPGIAALGGMIVPAFIYVLLTQHHEAARQGWAIPTATDIAFSLGVLSLLGSRIPPPLKIFLMALAVFDDLAAIVIIAIFYTSEISYLFLSLTFFCISMLVFLNMRKINSIFLNIMVGVGLWFCLMKSGIHPTLAGVVLAFALPLRTASAVEETHAYKLKNYLHPWVAFGILPLFAFVNAGVSLTTIFSHVDMSIVIAIFLGLFFGKPIGVFGFCWLSSMAGWTQLLKNTRWFELFALSFLCGIGFTISLFIGTLAFGDDIVSINSVKLGVLLGSFFWGIVGYILLRFKT